MRRAEKVPDNCSNILDLVYGDHGDEIVRAWRCILVADPFDTLALVLKRWDDSVPVRLCAVELIGSLAWDDRRAFDLLTMTSIVDPDARVREAALGSLLVVWSRLHR